MSTSTPISASRRLHAQGLLDAAFTILIVLIFSSFLGRFHWLFELLSHFRVQYAVLLSFALVVYTGQRRILWAGIAFGALLICLVTIVDACLPPVSAQGSGDTFKVMVIHVNIDDEHHGRALNLIRSKRPDLTVMEDVTPGWERIVTRKILETSDARFQSSNGTALLSIRQWNRIGSAGIASWGLPGLKAIFTDPGLTVFAVHIPAPISSDMRKERSTQFAKLAREVNKARYRDDDANKSEARPVLVIGDLNCTPWSPLFKDLLRTTGLRNTRNGFGIKATWPSITPPLLIPIDHVLVSDNDFQILKVEVGPAIGSDHYPFLVTMKRALIQPRRAE